MNIVTPELCLCIHMMFVIFSVEHRICVNRKARSEGRKKNITHYDDNRNGTERKKAVFDDVRTHNKYNNTQRTSE